LDLAPADSAARDVIEGRDAWAKVGDAAMLKEAERGE
jgi:hypothetical protein